MCCRALGGECVESRADRPLGGRCVQNRSGTVHPASRSDGSGRRAVPCTPLPQPRVYPASTRPSTERLPEELAITRSPMVVVDGLLTMHGDDAVSSLESRTLLRRHVGILRNLAHRNHAAVIAITGHDHGRIDNAQHVRYLRRHSQNHLEGTWRGRRRRRMLHVFHPRTGIRGVWRPFHRDPQTAFLLSRRRLSPQEVAASVDVLALHHTEP